MSSSGSAPLGHSSPISLMSCVREREPEPEEPPPQTELAAPPDQDKNEPSKKRRFHPFRGLRRMFRRKARLPDSEETVQDTSAQILQDSGVQAPCKDSHRSRSTSELLAGDEPTRRKSGGGGICPGLSVSHDSVFTVDQSSDLDTDAAQSSSSLSIQQIMNHPNVRNELLDVVRRRRDRQRGDTSEDEEDLGLPRSPCNSPTVKDQALKNQPSKSHSTCSDGSLLSMGSSEMDEDSFGTSSRHSSKLSLQDRPVRQTVKPTDPDLELDTGALGAPLSHSAARHKMSIKPKRTHGAPRRRRNPQVTTSSALPTTFEVNEETTGRSSTPESSANRELMAELYSTTSMNKAWHTSNSSEQQLKSASLPPGLALSSGVNKLSRSRSNAGPKRGDAFPEEDEDDRTSKEDKKKEESFFGRFLARRSGKKQTKKSKSEDIAVVKSTEVVSSYKQVDERRTISVDIIDSKQKVTKTENHNTKTENVFCFTQTDDNIEEKQLKKLDDFNVKVVDNIEKQFRKMKSEDLNLTKQYENQEKQLKRIKSEDHNIKINDNLEKHTKKLKSEDFNITKYDNRNKQVTKIKNDDQTIKNNLEELNITKINDSLLIENQCKKLKQDDFVIKTNDLEKHTRRVNSDDYILIKTNDSLSLHKQSEERKNSVDSGVKCSIPRTGPAARQRIQPIDIPASPDAFRRKRQSNMDIDTLVPPLKNSPEQTSFFLDSHNRSSPPKTQVKTSLDQSSVLQVHHLSSSSKTRVFHVSRQIKIGEDKSLDTEKIDSIPQLSPKPIWTENYPENKFEEKSRVKIAGLSSYQQKVLSYDDSESFMSLNENIEEDITSKVSKSLSVRSKTTLIQDASNTSKSSDSFSSSIAPLNDKKSIDIEHYDSLNKNEPLSFTSHSDSIDDGKHDQQKLENLDNIIISCVNSQMLSSVNTHASNQVVVSISSSDIESTENELPASPSSQISITRVQLKKDSKNLEDTKTTVPEFLKIQLNKVDIKPNSNIVLSTSAESTEEKQVKSVVKNANGCETDKENGEMLQRKFSKEDVEIIDKNTLEVFEIPKFNNIHSSTSDETTTKQNVIVPVNKTDRKSCNTPSVIKPFLKKKSNSIELSDSALKNLNQDCEVSEKNTLSSEQLSPKIDNLKDKAFSADDISDASDTVVLRRKSSASIKKDKNSDEPELMKVFARRSLKLKDSEAESLSQQVMILIENSQSVLANDNNNTSNRSRDSDKENEFNESPPEERKKIIFQSYMNLKDPKPLNESKFVETSEVTIRKSINNKIAAFNNSKFQTATSLNCSSLENTQETRKIKSFIEQKTEKPKIIEKNINRSRIMAFKEKDIDTKKSDVINIKCANTINDEVITNVSLKNNEFENEEYVPMFKRISQRKEEWEQRAQLAMKKTVP